MKTPYSAIADVAAPRECAIEVCKARLLQKCHARDLAVIAQYRQG